MDFLYEKVLRPLLFRLDPEQAHFLAAESLKALSALSSLCRLIERFTHGRAADQRPVELFGLRFPNAVGLAAGLDKNAGFWPALHALGFGHVEIGTVTWQRQPGNPRPRLSRYPEQEAIINRMGFNNDGAQKVARRLHRQFKSVRPRAPLGINIGKSRAASLDDATADYLKTFHALAEFADYFAINVSSPNTPDLRKLQEESRLIELLEALTTANETRAAEKGRKRIPLLLKIAPDLTFQQIDNILETAARFGLDGIIATNTTLARPGFFSKIDAEGGLSGRPLRERSTEVVRYIAGATKGRLPVIGVGGINDIESAREKIDAGASLVQIYTGMIYRGPFFARDIARELSKRPRSEG